MTLSKGKRKYTYKHPEDDRTDRGARYLPTEKEIAEAAEQIREGWDECRMLRSSQSAPPIELTPLPILDHRPHPYGRETV